MNFDLKLIIIGIVTILSSLVLGLIGTGDTNRIISFDFSKTDFEQRVLPTDQEVIIEFTRPLLVSQEFENLIKLEPEVALEFQLQSNKLIIRPLEILEYDVEYNLTISNEIKDIFQKNLITNFEREFVTSRALFLIEEPNIETVDSNLTSNLILKDVNNSDYNLTIAENIPLVSVAVDPTRQYVVYSTEPDPSGKHELFSYNLATNQTRRLSVNKDLLIEQLQFDRDGELWFYGSITDNDLFGLTQDEYPDVFSNIYKYNLRNNRISEAGINTELIQTITEFWVPPDGNTLLLQNFDYDILILDQNDPQRFISIGRFNEIGGFNQLGDKLGVVEIDNTVLEFSTNSKVISPDEELFVSSSDIVTTRPDLNLGGNLLALSARDRTIPTAEGVFKTQLIELNEESESKVLEINTEDTKSKSYYLPQFNNSGQYLAVESTDIEILENIQRNIRSRINAGQALESETVIYQIDPENNTEIAMILENNINLFWLP